MKRVLALFGALLFSFLLACNHGRPPEPNASKQEGTKPEVRTPSGGGSETADKRSVPDNNPPPPENRNMGSAVPPAPADQSRPQPQNQQTSTSAKGSAGTPSARSSAQPR